MTSGVRVCHAPQAAVQLATLAGAHVVASVRDPARHGEVAALGAAEVVTPDDVASMIMFLCSEQGRRISGQAIGVDGHTEFI